MNPSVIDHLLVLIMVVGTPFWALHDFRRFVRRVQAGDPGARLREFRSTLVVQWAFAAILAGWWAYSGRPWAALGVAVRGGGRGVAAACVAVGTAVLIGLQWRAITRLDKEKRERLRAQIGKVEHLLPRTPIEARWFRALAVTAGVCEELGYRGFLIWYLAPIAGPWPAAVVSTVAFGLAHAYQGRTSILKTGFVGAFVAALYLLGGSLLWPAAVHALIDLQGGAAGRLLVSDAEEPAA